MELAAVAVNDGYLEDRHHPVLEAVWRQACEAPVAFVVEGQEGQKVFVVPALQAVGDAATWCQHLVRWDEKESSELEAIAEQMFVVAAWLVLLVSVILSLEEQQLLSLKCLLAQDRQQLWKLLSSKCPSTKDQQQLWTVPLQR